MKRFIYSKYTKFIASVIFVACIVLGALTATTGINNLMKNEKDMIYNIMQIVHDIGIDGYSQFDKEYVFLRLLDESIGVHMGKCNVKNNLENAFLEK